MHAIGNVVIYCLMRMIVKLCWFSVLQHCHVRPYQQAFAAINNHRQSRSLDLENCVLSSVLCKCVDLLQLQRLASASHLLGP